MKRATIYLRKGKYLIHASSRTIDGVWIVWQPTFALTEDESAEYLGRKIVAALDGSRSNVPHPSDWKSLSRPLLELGGVKSWATFCKSCVSAEVEEEGGRVAVVPTRNRGPKDGFEPDPSQQILTSPGDLVRLGEVAAALLRLASGRDGSD